MQAQQTAQTYDSVVREFGFNGGLTKHESARGINEDGALVVTYSTVGGEHVRNRVHDEIKYVMQSMSEQHGVNISRIETPNTPTTPGQFAVVAGWEMVQDGDIRRVPAVKQSIVAAL